MNGNGGKERTNVNDEPRDIVKYVKKCIKMLSKWCRKRKCVNKSKIEREKRRKLL